MGTSSRLKQKLSKVKSKKDSKSQEFVYKPLEEGEGRSPLKRIPEYKGPAYEVFVSIRWDEAWKKFLELDEDGNFKYSTSLSMAKELAKGISKEDSTKRANLLYKAIGPLSVASKEELPYLGDWEYMRSSLFVGEVQKESLLFGNPRISTIREVINKHADVMEISKGLGDILLGWLGRYESWSQQVDEHFEYKLFDPKLSERRNYKRFEKYTKMQEYCFSRVIDATTQVLKCFGVGKDDISLLSQMMIAAMRGKLGDQTANIMLASASGTKIGGALDGKMLGGGVGESKPENEIWESSPSLKLMLGSFVQKSMTYKMEHPDVDIPGVPEEDLSTDPRNKVKMDKQDGKVNGDGKKVYKN